MAVVYRNKGKENDKKKGKTRRTLKFIEPSLVAVLGSKKLLLDGDIWLLPHSEVDGQD